MGPFEASPHNPILTQRDLPAGRAHPVSNAGHVDLVDTPDGQWWAVFLASRPYAGERYNTGRETFLLPVHWRDGWPSILPAGEPIPYVAKSPRGAKTPADQAPLSGNFTWRDDFAGTSLQREWLSLRVPKAEVADLRARAGWVTLHASAQGLDSTATPRLPRTAPATHALYREHRVGGAHAGRRQRRACRLAEFQRVVCVGRATQRRCAGRLSRQARGRKTTTLARTRIPATAQLRLQISGDGGAYSFAFDADGRGWQSLHRNDAAGMLSTAQAGGFVGSMIGPFAQLEPHRTQED